MSHRKPPSEEQKKKAAERVRRHRARKKEQENSSNLYLFEETKEKVMTETPVTLDKLELAKLAGLLIVLLVTIALLFFQVLPLYASSSWVKPELSAAGSLLIVLTLSSFFSFKRGIISFLLCSLGLFYEISFVSWSTEKSEEMLRLEKLSELSSKDERLLELKKEKAYSGLSFESQKDRFENPEDKMFRNHWYYTNYVTPSLQAKEAIETKYDSRLEELKQQASAGKNTVTLKILYRICLILSLMILTHFFLSNICDFFAQNEKILKEKLK